MMITDQHINKLLNGVVALDVVTPAQLVEVIIENTESLEVHFGDVAMELCEIAFADRHGNDLHKQVVTLAEEVWKDTPCS